MPLRSKQKKMASAAFDISPGENGTRLYQIPNHGSRAMDMLTYCWRQYPSLCDAAIIVQNQQFFAHRAVLMACSDFFKELYKSFHYDPCNPETLRQSVKLPKLSPATFHLFLEFAYTGKLDLSMRSVKLWLEVGCTLLVPTLKDAACHFLKHETNSDNCMDIIAIAEEFDLADIKHQANRAMCERLIQLSQSLRNQEIQASHMSEPSSDEDEDDVYDEGAEEGETESDAENEMATRIPATRQSPRKQPLRPVRQARYRSPTKMQEVPRQGKVETKAALKGVVLRPRRLKLPPEPRAPSQRASAMRQRALKAKRDAIEVVSKVQKEYPCKFCDFVSNRQHELKTHYIGEHARCNRCRKVFQHPEELTKHLETHRQREEKPAGSQDYVCQFCGKKSHCRSALMIHVRTHTGEKPYECEHCHARFIQSINLKRHVLSYHMDEEPYACNICGKKFRVLVYLKSHEIMHSQDRPYQCEACGAMFKRKSDLRSHRRVHSSNKPYACNLCSTKFKTTNDLKSHMLIHDDQKPHKCPHCDASFKRSGHLNRHMMIHTKKKPYKCEQCKAQFNRKENLRSHQRIHSGELPYNCKVCNVTFRHLSSLKMHEKSHLTGKPSPQKAPPQEQQPHDQRIQLMQLLTPPAPPPSNNQVVMEEAEARHLSGGRQVVPVHIQVAHSSLHDLAGTATAGGIDINLVNLATGTLNQPSHTPSPPPTPQDASHQLEPAPSPNPDALLSLNTTQALAQVQAEAQAQIQAHMSSQSGPLQLTAAHHAHHHHPQHSQHGQAHQSAQSLISGTISTVTVQGTHQFILTE